MKLIYPVVFALSAYALNVNAEAPAAKPETLKDRMSYFIGQNMGDNFKQRGLEVNVDVVMRGLKDSLANAEPALSQEEIKQTLTEFQTLQKQEKAKQDQARLEEGKKFLQANKSKEGVVSLPSGLQYKIVKAGTGKQPGPNDTVTTHYRGTLIDGSEFDSSYKRGKPASFPVSGVIKGWTEALQLMKEGAKWELFVPSELAYGERGAGSNVPANSTLLFEVELIAVNDKVENKK